MCTRWGSLCSSIIISVSPWRSRMTPLMPRMLSMRWSSDKSRRANTCQQQQQQQQQQHKRHHTSACVDLSDLQNSGRTLRLATGCHGLQLLAHAVAT
jgi:hypothetical protein